MKAVFDAQPKDGGYCTMGSGVEAYESQKGKIDTLSFSRYQFDNDPMVRATWGSYKKGGFKSFDELNEWLREKMPEYYMDPKKPVMVEGKCIDERLHPYDMIQRCEKSDDCKDDFGHFNGGCCGRIELAKGKPDK